MRKLPLVLAALLTGCRVGESPPENFRGITRLEPAAGGEAYEGEAEIFLKTKEFDLTVRKVKGFAGSLGGFLVSSEIYEERPRSAYLTLAVPAGRLYEFVDSVRAMGSAKVIRLKIKERRIEERLTRLSSRLSNKKALVERLRKLMAEAKSVSEAIEVERELAKASDELAELEAQLEALERRAKFSYIGVEIKEFKKGSLPAFALVSLLTLAVASLLALVGAAILFVKGARFFGV